MVGHADEDRGIVPRDEPRPERGVARPLVHDRGVAAIERVHQASAEHVGPVEPARVEDAVALGAEVEPVGGRRLAAEERAVRVQDALRVAGRAGGVDEVGGVLGARRLGVRPARDPGERGVERENPEARRAHLARPHEEHVRQEVEALEGAPERAPARLVGDHGGRAGIARQVEDLLGRQQHRGGHRDGGPLHRPQEDDRVLEAVGQSDEDARAAPDADLAEALREAARRRRQLGEGRLPHARGIVIDDHRRSLGDRRAQVRVGARDGDVEALRDVPDPGREVGHGG